MSDSSSIRTLSPDRSKDSFPSTTLSPSQPSQSPAPGSTPDTKRVTALLLTPPDSSAKQAQPTATTPSRLRHAHSFDHATDDDLKKVSVPERGALTDLVPRARPDDAVDGVELPFSKLKVNDEDDGDDEKEPESGEEQQLFSRQTYTSPDPLHNPNNTSNVYINGLPPFFSHEQLTKLAAQFGRVLSCRVFHRFNQLKPNGGGQVEGSTYAFVLYESVEEAKKCIVELRKYSDIHPSFARTQRLPAARAPQPQTAEGLLDKTRPAYRGSPPPAIPQPPISEGAQEPGEVHVLIQGLPHSATPEFVKALILPQQPVGISLIPIGTEASPGATRVAYVRFATKHSAAQTITKLHRLPVDGEGSTPLTVLVINPVEPAATGTTAVSAPAEHQQQSLQAQQYYQVPAPVYMPPTPGPVHPLQMLYHHPRPPTPPADALDYSHVGHHRRSSSSSSIGAYLPPHLMHPALYAAAPFMAAERAMNPQSVPNLQLWQRAAAAAGLFANPQGRKRNAPPATVAEEPMDWNATNGNNNDEWNAGDANDTWHEPQNGGSGAGGGGGWGSTSEAGGGWGEKGGWGDDRRARMNARRMNASVGSGGMRSGGARARRND